MLKNSSVNSGGVHHSTKSIGKLPMYMTLMIIIHILQRSFLEIYQKCETSADIDAAQQRIMDGLEADWNEARKKKGSYDTSIHSICSFDSFKDASGDEPEDLLLPNPNHGIIPDDESDGEDENGQPKPLGSDPISELNEASVLAAAVE